jgi:phosphate acetyltransferase
MSAYNFIESLQIRASALKKRIALPDASDERTLSAARMLIDSRLAIPILIGVKSYIQVLAERIGLSLEGIEIMDSATSPLTESLASTFYNMRKHKGITRDQALQTVRKPLYFAGSMAARGMVDCCVAGSLSSTSEVLRAGIQTVGLKEGISTASSYFMMIFPERVLAFADCGVVPYPDSKQLCDIALSTSDNFSLITGDEPRIAFLSFSTKGSADHESVSLVRRAFTLFREKAPNSIADGELQVDAALLPDVAERKAPGSALEGNSNILIFPNLDAGNIAYKLCERLGGAIALGPIVQGLKIPYCDLSRGCSVEDIVNVSCIAALMSAN